jgi:hypothetical protein
MRFLEHAEMITGDILYLNTSACHTRPALLRIMRGKKRLHASAEKSETAGVSLRLVALQRSILRLGNPMVSFRKQEHVTKPLQTQWSNIVLCGSGPRLNKGREPRLGHRRFNPDNIQPLRSIKL